jgi:hypothetical protein
MRNSSHSPGCMRAFPASQSCQVRSVEDYERGDARFGKSCQALWLAGFPLGLD